MLPALGEKNIFKVEIGRDSFAFFLARKAAESRGKARKGADARATRTHDKPRKGSFPPPLVFWAVPGPYRRTWRDEEKAEEGRKILGQKDKGEWKREFFDWGPNNSLFQHWVSPKNI